MSRRHAPRALLHVSTSRSLAVVVVVAMISVLTGASAFAAPATVFDGITTTDLNAVGMSPDALASTIVGPGVSVSNVTFSGSNAQAGTLHVVDPAVVSFNDGIIMSSGNVADVVGPNKSDSTTGDMAGPADADLNLLIQNTQTVNPVTYDATVLEFDFVPSSNHVYFTYTFGSDEYLEWVNLFNDVFAFYVNGQNCATVPSGDPISIDTINDVVNPSLFRDNSFSAPPANPINIESDGLSVEMICSAPVNAGETNHMKLAIADTSDQILDSVVMIKADSLSTTPPESCNNAVDDDNDDLVDDNDPQCSGSTTPPPTGGGGIGSDGSAPPFTGNEGTPIPLDASALEWTATGDTVSTTWTVTGINGTPGTCEVSPSAPQPLNGDGSIAVVSAICPNEGEYVASVDGTDTEGSSAFDYDVDFFVHNAPPAVTIDTPAAPMPVGTPVDLSATVTDPGVNDTFGCEISWGDGVTDTGTVTGGTCTGTHTYAVTGSYLLSVTATDDAGDSAAAAMILSVVPPACDAPGAIVGTPGNDLLKGTKGADTICGLGGNDTLKGGNGSDTLLGGEGNDRLVGANGDDQLSGGAGTQDMVLFTAAPGPVTASLATGTATGQGSDTFDGAEGLTGATFPDVLTGSAGNDKLVGGAGADTLTDVTGGADTLRGQIGNDTLTAGDGTSGNDTLSGDNDVDTCSADVGDVVKHCEV